MKLFRAGELNRELLDLILLNCRIPDQNWGDIKAQVASLNVAERRIHELVDRYGRETIKDGITDLMDHAEVRARELIRRIPDGDYEFVDYMEDAGVGEATGLIRIKLTLRVRDGGVVLDFDGTDHQVQAAFNLPTWNQRGHYMVSFPILNFFRTLDPDVPYNAGLIRPLELSIPRGTLLNPEAGAAYGVRAATMFRVLDCLNGALTQALPGVIPAASSGGIAIVLVSTLDPQTGARVVSVAQPLNGGSGGRPRQEGIDGTSFTGGWLRNIPNEMLEADVPVLVEEYGYRVGSGGPGRHRGGTGVRFRLRTLGPDTLMTARGLERFVLRPYGLQAGRPGERYRVRLNPGGTGERDLGKIDVLRLERGDVVEFETSSGGGFGDPLERDPWRVLADVEAGLVSAEQAERDYGVVVRDGGVDAEETARRRAAGSGRASYAVDVGDERRAYEALWSDEVATELLRLLDPLPIPLRPLVRAAVRPHIDALPAAPHRAALAELVEQALEQLGLRMPAAVGAAS
jgi:N-methylhydantoinase B